MTTFLYYSDGRKPEAMRRPVLARLLRQAHAIGAHTVGVTPEPISCFDASVQLAPGKPPRGIFDAILAGLPRVSTVFLCEDDCLYADCHFRPPNTPEGVFCYDLNMVHLCRRGFFSRYNRGAIALSMAWGEAGAIRAAMLRKLTEIDGNTFNCYEPAGSLGYLTTHWRAPVASIDIRHGHNTTWIPTEQDACVDAEPGWPAAGELVKEYSIE